MASAFSHVPLRTPPATPLFEDAEGGFLSDGEAEYGALGFWSMPDTIPAKLRAMVIAVEDRRFDYHPGMDLVGICRAILHSLGGRLEGGSTIAMQVVRMGYPRSRNLLAKAEEAVSALAATAVYGRERLLRHWLEVVPMGGNMYGVAYAARRCFKKPVEDLSWAETALLVSVPQDPRGRALFGFVSFLAARDRADAMLGQLAARGLFDADTLAGARSELAELPPFLREERPADSYHYVFRSLDEYAKARAAGTKATSVSRPIRTSLDPRVQDIVARRAEASIPAWRGLGADNLAVMVADARTGEVLAYLGSAGYFDAEHRGAIDYCRVSRSTGSTLKPFLYALGLESGAFNPGTVLADLPLRIKDARGEYSLTDFDDSYMGPLLYRRALANSRNVPAIRVLEGVGLAEAYNWLGKLGLHDFARPASFYGYGLAVGGVYTSLDRLVAAYGCLGNDGRRFTLRWLRDGTSRGDAVASRGDPVGSPPYSGSRGDPVGSPPYSASRGDDGGSAQGDDALISEDAARMISLFLSDPAARLPAFAGTALTHFAFPVAVKTGTSNGFRDAWALGYSRRYVVGIWAGNSDNRAMNRLAGSTVASLLLSLFSELQPEAVQGIGEEPFPIPRGWVSARLCPDSGLLAGEACPRAVLERFPPGAAPRGSCMVHTRVVVDSLNGEPAGPVTPSERRLSKTLTQLGPEYAAYSQSRGWGAPRADPDALITASVSLGAPLDGTRVIIDPETPARFQTLALRATVKPAVPEIVWFVDGAEFARVGFPYEARWPLSPGTHSFQARFARAFVESASVRVTVLGD
jgi:penicillin-binding protein 1C